MGAGLLLSGDLCESGISLAATALGTTRLAWVRMEWVRLLGERENMADVRLRGLCGESCFHALAATEARRHWRQI